MRKRVSQVLIFVILALMSLGIPLMIQAIFPGGEDTSKLPPETPLVANNFDAPTIEAARRMNNYAWLYAEQGSLLDTRPRSAGGEELIEPQAAFTEPDTTTTAGEEIDVRPGVFSKYVRSWDNLDIKREQFMGGGFVFLSSNTRVQAAGSRLRFRDNTDKIYGKAGRLDVAHLRPNQWLWEAGVERDIYDGLHSSWNADARVSGSLRSNLALTIEAGRQDIWERLTTIRERLRLWLTQASVFYQFAPRWWLFGLGNAGWYSDHNHRATAALESGYTIAAEPGLSVSVGAETTSFAEQRFNYWSPSYYGLLYGRLRLTRNYFHSPFAPRWRSGSRDRFGYLAEYTLGVNNDGRPEQSVRIGGKIHATERISLNAEFYHLESDGRFSTHYSENRIEAGVEFRF